MAAKFAIENGVNLSKQGSAVILVYASENLWLK